jgi:hypothetical protein
MEDVLKTSTRRILARFLMALAVVYVGVTIYFVVYGHYAVAIGNALTAALFLMVARMVNSMQRGGPGLLLSCTFIVALVSVNVLIWTRVF